jgi:hypothetical protein
MLAADINVTEGIAANLFQNDRATDTDVFKNM